MQCEVGVCIARANPLCSPLCLCACALLACLKRWPPTRCEGRASARLQVHSAFSDAAHAAPILGVQGA